MPDCTPRRFEFQGPGRREIVAEFSGGRISSDGGVVLLAEADVALRAAQASGHNTWQRFVPPAANQSEIYGAEHWRIRLREVLDAGNILLESQPVYGTGNRAKSIMHYD